MKICPTCKRRYEDETLRFCLEDGSLLAGGLDQTRPSPGAEPTLLLPEQAAEPQTTLPGPQPLRARSTLTSLGFKPLASAGQVEESSPTTDRRRSSPLWWVVLALIIGGSGIAIALIVTRDRQQDRTTPLLPATPTASPTLTVRRVQSASPVVEAAKSKITGAWELWHEGQPRGKPVTAMRIKADGTNIVVNGQGWTGRGSFDGQRGYYDWQFTDGKRGRTTIRLDADGKLHGEVRGSGLDWNYQALRR